MKFLVLLMLTLSTVYGVEVKKSSDKHQSAPVIPKPELPPLKIEVVTLQGREAVKFKFEDHTYVLFHNPHSSIGNDSYFHDPDCEKCKLTLWEKNNTPKKK